MRLLVLVGLALLSSCAGTPDDPRARQVRANLQLVMGDLPPESKLVPLDVRVVDEKKLETHTRKRITFAAEQGDRVPALLLLPNAPVGRKPAMLCLHQTSRLGKTELVGAGKPYMAYGSELAERGFVVLAPDYPNFGDYAVDPYALGYASTTMKGIWNHRRALDLLQSLPEVDPGRIGVIGHSLGGHNALFLAAFDERVRVVVTSCGFTSFAKYSGGNLAGWSHAGYMPRIDKVYGKDPARMPFDFPDILALVAPRPLFINAPLHDANFDNSGVRDCVEAVRPIYALPGNLVLATPDAGHDFPPDVRRSAYEFVERSLK